MLGLLHGAFMDLFFKLNLITADINIFYTFWAAARAQADSFLPARVTFAYKSIYKTIQQIKTLPSCSLQQTVGKMFLKIYFTQTSLFPVSSEYLVLEVCVLSLLRAAQHDMDKQR